MRVSAKDQNEDRQIIAMREVGVSEKNIYYAKKYVRSISADRVVVMGGHILVPDEQVYEIMNHTL